MSTTKPVVDSEQALALVREQFDAPISHLDIVEGGQVAQTFYFAAGGHEYILRFNRHTEINFGKEAYLYRTIDVLRIPIPPIVRIGRLDALHYAISHYIPGTPLDRLPHAEVRALIPQLIETLDAIHAVDVGAIAGYGIFGDNGIGLFPSWRAFLESIWDEEAERDFYGSWHHLFKTTFLERDVFGQIRDHMAPLLDACPEKRALIHGEYGFSNVLAQDGRITAVLDWIDAKYGDYLYDVAWVDFWSPELGFPDHVHRSCVRKGVDIPHYSQRLRCYRYYIGLNTLGFFAKAGRKDDYRWARDRTLSSLE